MFGAGVPYPFLPIFSVGMGYILLCQFHICALLKVGGGTTEGDRKDADEKEKNPGFGRSLAVLLLTAGCGETGQGKQGNRKEIWCCLYQHRKGTHF